MFVKSSETRADHWAFGIILLEILLGSRFVLALNEYGEFVELQDALEDYLHPEIYNAIIWLMGMGGYNNLKKLVDEILPENPQLMEEQIVALENAVRQDNKLYCLQKKAERRWVEKRDELC